MPRQEPKSFIIAGYQVLRRPDWCWLCPDLMKAGTRIAICRYGKDTNDWDKAHDTCADESPLNQAYEGGSASAGILWRQLDEYTGRNRYAVYLDGKEVIRTSAKDKAVGMVELLNSYPEAVKAILDAEGPERPTN